MGSWRVFLAGFVAAVPILVVGASPAHACSGDPGTLEDQVERADLIVIATVADIVVIEPLPTPEPLSPPSPLDFPPAASGVVVTAVAVEEYLKGSGPKTLEHERDRRPLCPYVSQELGDRALLFLNRSEEGALHADSFTSSLITAENEDDVLARVEQIRLILGTSTPTVPAIVFPIVGQPSKPATSVPWAAIAAGAVGVLLASGVLILSRPRR